jgi:2-polyprenyl-3-methyl-5-hydroxy-6-metoxy-1,4-benzoquinol methylase
VDLGTTPLCQRHVTPEQFNHPEPNWPLHAYVCSECFLVQLPAYVPPQDIFADNYAYFSSYSDSWLAHARAYAQAMVRRLPLGPSSRVVEIASNDGYLLRWFKELGVPVLGIEPAENCAQEARKLGIETLVLFFGVDTARKVLQSHGPADLLLGNNVLAHVPDINDFVAGMKILLGPRGVITMEFPHLVELMRQNQFDTIYHEHYSYLSLTSVARIFAAAGLTIFDVDQLPTHGGSLRIYARHTENTELQVTDAVHELARAEQSFGLTDLATYSRFSEQVRETKRKILECLIRLKRDGKTIAGYGAPGKGNTLLNFCGIGTDFLDFTVDRSPHKQGNFLPGSRIPILSPEAVGQHRPDYLFILPWNLKDEIMRQMAHIREWGGRFILPIPEVQIL